jgi:hypothetical protein
MKKEFVKNLGFEIENEWSLPESERHCINIGFTATKL